MDTKKTEIVSRDKKKRERLIHRCLQETHFKLKDAYRLKVSGQRKINNTNTELGRKKWEELYWFQPEQTSKKIIRDKDGHHINEKRVSSPRSCNSLQCACTEPQNVKCCRQTLIEQQEEIDEPTVQVEVLKAPSSQMGRFSRQQISKDMGKLTYHQSPAYK